MAVQLEVLSPSILNVIMGSATGVLAAKIFDLVQINRQHKLNLQKEYFARKLEVFEKAVAFWANTQSVLRGFDMAFQSLINPAHRLEEEISDEVMKIMRREYQDIHDKSKELAAPLRLYTELPENYHLIALNLTNYFNIYAELGDLLKRAHDKQINERKFTEELLTKADKLHKVSSEIIHESDIVIQSLRANLSRFDY